MNQHLHLITLGVRDFERSRKFYVETLGWKPASASNDDVVFFQAGGVVLGLYPREKLAEDALTSPEGNGFAGITLAYNAQSEQEVDAIIAELKPKAWKSSSVRKRFSGAGTVPTSPTRTASFGKWLTIPFSRSMKVAISS